MHILSAIMETEHHPVRTYLFGSGCKRKTLMGIKKTGIEEGERDSNNKMNVQLHILGKNSFVVW